MTNRLFYGDNLDVLRDHTRDESVDLIYLDPPFNSQANYNILFRAPTGAESKAQIEAFEDTWHWNATAEEAFDEVMTSGNAGAAEMLRSMRSFLNENDVMAYLTMMTVRLLHLHRVLKPTGSIYLHCDPTASHYLKVLMDGIFGATNFRNEIIWKRTSAHSGAKRWGDIHDVVLFYTKSMTYTWNQLYQAHDEAHVASKYNSTKDSRGFFMPADLTGAGLRGGDSGKPWKGFDPNKLNRHWAVPKKVPMELVDFNGWKSLSTQEKLDSLDAAGLIYWPAKVGGFPRFKRYLSEGVPIQSVITDISPLNSQAQERLGYPTQKPLTLLERIISASSNPGDVILDPFCGCGTAVHAAQKLERRWTGIDITHLAISLIEKRLKDAFPGIAFETHGTPKDFEGAMALAERDKYQFQWWAVSLVDAVPFGGKKKGADGGIDGLIFFKPDGKKTEKAVVSVKGGLNVSVSMIRDLAHVVDREKARVGVFVTLAEPTSPMKLEAHKAGFYKTEHGNYPKIQILKIEDLMEGAKPLLPWRDTTAFKKAAKEETAIQPMLL